jgi:RHS repeat-associated protein
MTSLLLRSVLSAGALRLRAVGSLFLAASLAGVVSMLVFGVPVSRPASRVAAKPPVLEVAGLRSAASDTFLEPDGSFKTTLYPHPVNYRDASGEWRRIDSTFAKATRPGFAWQNRANAFKADFKANGIDPGFLGFDPGQGAAFSLGLLGAARAIAAKDAAGELEYKRVLPGTDLRYQLLPQGVKETLLLRDARAPATYRFRLQPTGTAHLNAVVQADGSAAFYARRGAEPVFTIAAPTVADSTTAPTVGIPTDQAGAPPGSTPQKGGVAPVLPGPNDELAAPAVGKASLGVQRQKDGSFELTIRVDHAWLSAPERVFPVAVDPTIETHADIQDGYWNSASTTSLPNVSDPELYAGYDGTGANYASAMRFDLGTIPPSATVTSAKVSVYATRCIPTSAAASASFGCPFFWPGAGVYSSTMELYQISNGWNSSTQWQSLLVDGTSLGSFGGQFYQSTGTRIPGSFTLAGPALAGKVQAIVNGSVANNGFLLKKTAGDASGLAFAGSRYADVSLAPRLDIQWSASGVQLADVMHVHSNGAELFWQHYSGGLGPYAQAVESDLPTAYWRLDDTASSPLGIADSSGNESNAGSSGGVTLGQAGATADGDQAASFNGSNGYVETGAGPLTNIADTFTIEAFIKRSDLTLARHTIFSRGESNGGGFRLEINNNNQLELANGTCDGCLNGNYTWVALSTQPIADLNWHHVVATKSGASIHLYIDGVDVTGAINNRTMTVGWNLVDLGDNVFADYVNGGTGRDSFFGGQIDDAAVYDHVLTPTQIAAHYNARLQTIAGFDRYEIHRSTVSGFTPSAATLIATIKNDAAIQSYRDTTARPGTTFFYKVVTYTNGGANSYTSNQVVATTLAAGQASVTIQPGLAGGNAKATSISSGNSCANQGATQTLSLDASNRSLLQFDLRQIPNGSTVTAATLKLFTFSAAPATVEVHRVTSDWTEGTAPVAACDGSGASWTNRNPSVGWALAGGDYDGSAVTAVVPGGIPHWDSWTVTNIVQGWLSGANANFGFLLKHQNELGAPSIAYVSNDYTTSLALRPQLVVSYTDNSAAAGPSVGVNVQGVSALPGTTPSVTGTVNVNAVASDDGQVAGVQFKLDGNNLGVADTTAPYSVSWNSTTASRGNHTLTAVATDDAGNQTTSAGLPVIVANSASPTVTVTSAGSSSPYAATVTSTPPAAYWRVGETSGSTFASAIGTFNGTWTNTPTINAAGAIAGDPNGAVALSAASLQYGTVASSPSLGFTNNMTIEAWVKQAATGTLQAVVGKPLTTATPAENYAIWIDATNKPRVEFGNGTLSVQVTAPTALAGGWHHIVGTFASGVATLYVDGSQANTGSTVGLTTLASNTGTLDVGHAGTGNYFGGSLDELAIYGSALTAAAVATHYAQGTTLAPTWTLNATAADDVGVSKVEFLVDGNRVATDSTSPYSVSIDTLAAGIYDGAHTVSARAYDADGNATLSAGYPITVSNGAASKYKATVATSHKSPLTVSIPVGAVLPYAGSDLSLPAGWAFADGSAVSRTTYSALLTAIGVAYGAGDGSTTFNLPNLQGRLPLGKASAGTGSTLGSSGGSLNMGGGTISLPPVPSLSFTTPAVGFTAGAVSAQTPIGFSFPTSPHYNFWAGDSELRSVSVGAGGALAAGWTTFTMPPTTASAGPVTPTATLATAAPAYRVLRYIIKTDATAVAPTCAIWPSAVPTAPAGMQPATGAAATGALTTCLDSTFGASVPDLQGRFPLGRATTGAGSTLNGSGGSLNVTQGVTRSVPGGAAVSVPNYSTSLTVPGGSYPTSYGWYAFGQGNGTGAWIIRCSGGGPGGLNQVQNPNAIGTCEPPNATTPAVATAAASGGGSSAQTNALTDTASTAAVNPAYVALNYAAPTSSGYTPAAGLLTPYGGATVPTGWLKADGSCYNPDSYPDLFAAIGYTYGGGTTSFCLPNLQGRFPLGKAASGTGSTLGGVGGSLDIVPAAALPAFSPTFNWTPSSFAFTIPDRTATLNLGACSFDVNTLGTYCDHEYADILQSGITATPSGVFTSSPFGATSFTATPSTPGARTVTGTATGAATASFAAENPAYQVVNYLISLGGTTATTSFVPSEMRYDPTAVAQTSAPVTVTLTNNSSLSWPAASIKLRYRWLNPDGSELSNSGDIPIGADLAAGGVRDVAATVQPPTLPAYLMRGRFTLRFDLWDASCSCYFAGKGNKPLDRTVTVTRVQPDELGLERYQQYDGTPLGGGMSSSVNLFNGNQAISWTPFNEPGLGLNTVLGLTYNSLENGSASPLGNNWSLAVSGLTPFGLPLDIHPNADDTAAGRTANWIGFTDADGTYHRFNGNTAGTYYTAPAGVHLYLKVNTADPLRYYGFVKPDRTAFYFDSGGYPTRVEDGDGNALVFTETDIAAGDDVSGLAKQITKVTDAGNRSFTLAYYTAASTAVPALRGKLKSVTDHIGRQLTFVYYDDGNLLRITEKGGQNADGTYLPDRSFVLTYTTPTGSGPAIPGATSARLNPDPGTSQSTKLYSVIDFRGDETSWSYATTGATQWRVTGVTTRAGEQTSYAYNTTTSTTTITKPLSRVSSYVFDANGRPTSTIDPLSETFNIAWTSDNMPQTITNAATGKYLEFAYNANGQLTDKWDELRDHTTIAYQNLPIDANDAAANWEVGRAIGHISRPISIVQPTGNATTANATDYKTTFDYASTTADHVFHVTDPLGNITTNHYNANGTLGTQTLPANGDGITRTTTYNTRDNNGLLTKVTDPAGGIAQVGYDAAGNLLWTQDPNHGSYTGGDPTQYRSSTYYDSYGRPGRTSTPKSTAYRPGLLTWSDTVYDANDDTSSQSNPHFGIGDTGSAPTTSTTFDAMDRPLIVTGPRGAADGGPVKSKTTYDAAGRPFQVTTPNGVNSGIAKLGTTQTVYDALDRPHQTLQYAVTAGLLDNARTRITNYCYDVAGDLRSVTGPKGAASFNGCPLATASPYVYSTAPFTTDFQYDAAHRKLKTTDPSGTVVSQIVYNENGAVTQATDANNKVTQYSYSDRGEKIKEIDPFDSSTLRTITSEWTYDPLGDLASFISPRAYDIAGGTAPFTNYVTRYHYDADKRLTSTDLPIDGTTPASYSYVAYDANGDKTMVSLPSAQTNQASLAVTEKTTDSYWDSGAIYSQTDPATPTVRFDYTAEGWQASRIPELTGQAGTLDYTRATFWDYYPDGLLRSLRDLGGERAYYSYDADGNQTSATQATGITQATQGALTVQQSFDDLDQLTKVRTPKPGSANWLATTYGYDLHGLTNQMVDNLEETPAGSQVNPGRVLAYSFNNLDQVTTQTDDFATAADATDDEQVTYSYTPAGLLDTRTLSKKSAGAWVQEQKVGRTYFDNGLLKQLTNYDGTNAVIEQHTLAYMAGTGAGTYLNGNKASDAFKIKNADGSATCWTTVCNASWTYDANNRLTQANDGTGNTTSYTLDVEGNITQQTTGLSSTTNTYNGQQLATTTTGGGTGRYLYDSSGNTDCIVTSSWTASTCPTAGSAALLTDYVYDYKNRLADYRAYSGGSLTDSSDYTNDPLDRPIAETETHSGVSTTTTFRYIGASNAVSREDLSGATTSSKTYSYDAMGLRLTLAVTPQGSATSRYSYTNDDHGSISLLIDQASTVDLSYGYNAYGSSNASLTKTATGFNADTNPYRYSNKRWDTGSNSYDMGARRYSPATSRFLQQDAYNGAFADLGLSSSQLTANRYLFTGANPIGYVELDGHHNEPASDETCTPGRAGCLAVSPTPSPQPSPSPAPEPGPTATNGFVPSVLPADPAGQACTFGNGCFNLTDSDFRNATWAERSEWLAAVNNRFNLGGWLNSIAGIVDYLGESVVFGADPRMLAADGWVLWAVAQGLKDVYGSGSNTKWGDFFSALSKGRTSDQRLLHLWGLAEQEGVEFGTAMTSFMEEPPLQAGLYSAFVFLGDQYRDAVIHSRSLGLFGIGIRHPDPRRDREAVHDYAAALESGYLALYGH